MRPSQIVIVVGVSVVAGAFFGVALFGVAGGSPGTTFGLQCVAQPRVHVSKTFGSQILAPPSAADGVLSARLEALSSVAHTDCAAAAPWPPVWANGGGGGSGSSDAALPDEAALPVSRASMSTLACRAAEVGGGCVLGNVCHTAGAGWALYTGAEARCLAAAMAGAPCAGETFTVPGTFVEHFTDVPFAVLAGAPPAGARWHGDDVAAVICALAFGGDNFYHTVTDLALPLFWQLRWLLGHRAFLLDRGGGGGGGGGGNGASAAPRGRIIFSPLLAGEDYILRRVLAAFPGVTLAYAAALADAADAPAPAPPGDAAATVCFRRAAVGGLGAQLGRNAGGHFHAQRTIARPVTTRREAAAEFSALAAHLTSWLLPPAPPPPRRRRRLAIIDRRGDRNRLAQVHAVAEMARGLASLAAEPWDVTVLVLETMTLAEAAGNLSAVDILVGVHGAGLTNAIFMPPGGRVVEISPCGIPTQLSLAQVSWAVGHEHFFFNIPCGERGSDIDVSESEHFKSLLAFLLPIE